MEKIEFLEFIEACTGFINNPEDEEAVKKYNEMQNKLVVKSYLPIGDKTLVLYRMVIDSDKSINLPASVFTTGLELAALFNGLLAYTNVDNNVPLQYKIYETYDVIYQSGMADYILSFCQNDYNRLMKMMERTLEYSNLIEFVNTVKNMDTKEIQKLIAEVKTLQQTIDPDTLKNLSTIIQYNDPLMHQLKEEVVDVALDEMDKIKLNNSEE